MSGVRITLSRYQAELLQRAAGDLSVDGETAVYSEALDDLVREGNAWRTIEARARAALAYDARPKVKP